MNTDITITKIIIEGVFSVLFALMYIAFNKYLKPWLIQNNLVTAAQVAVQAAEAMYGRYNGEQKLRQALSQLKKNGFDIEADDVLSAVQAAWSKLNIDQIAAGIKEADKEKETNVSCD